MSDILISPYEAEQLIESLQPIPIEEVGSQTWMLQHEHLERLNMQAHQSAQSKHDEFVVDSFVMSDKLSVLIHELIVIEAWKEKVLPLIRNKVNEDIGIKLYMIMYHEATLCGLLQVCLYHENSVKSCSDCIVELADYCHRKLIILNSGKCGDHRTRERLEVDESPSDSVHRQFLTIELSLCSLCINLLRFLTDHLEALPLAVVTRMLNTHDVPVSLINVLEGQAFTRRDRNGLEKFSEARWSTVEGGEQLRLTKLEAQLWIALYNLIMTPLCRQKYRIDAFRKTQILRLKKYFNEVLIDQLPMLEQLWRTIEQLSMMDAPAVPDESPLLLEQVPELRQALVERNDWQQLAEKQLRDVLNDGLQSRIEQAKRFAEMYNMDDLEGLMEEPKCSKCGKAAEKRCSQCKMEWYCSRKCQLDCWTQHKKLCELLQSNQR